MQLAFRRALRTEGSESSNRLLAHGSTLIDCDIMPPSLGEILADPLVTDANGWLDERILQVFSDEVPSNIGTERVATPVPPVSAVRADELVEYRLANAHAHGVLASVFPIPGGSYDYPEVTEIVSFALLHNSFHLGYEFALRRSLKWHEVAYYRPLEARTEPIPAAMLRYPPGSFVHYLGSDLLRHRNAGLNLDHPLTAWLLAATESLFRQRPGVRANLWSLLSRPIHDEDDVAETVASVNELLNLLRDLRFDPAPPRDLRLRPADFDHE